MSLGFCVTGSHVMWSCFIRVPFIRVYRNWSLEREGITLENPLALNFKLQS